MKPPLPFLGFSGGLPLGLNWFPKDLKDSIWGPFKAGGHIIHHRSCGSDAVLPLKGTLEKDHPEILVDVP